MQSSDYPSVNRLADLQQFVADFSRVTRVPQLANTGRLENDVDHSYALALTCWFLAPKIAPELSLEKILKYALAHDTVEIHAGDTFVFAHEDHIASKSDREDEAIEQLEKEWPDFSEMIESARGYKQKVNEEAKFVKAIDKILPLLVIELGESSAFWRRLKITLDMEIENKVTIKVSDYVEPYYDMTIEWLRARGNMYDPKKEKEINEEDL
jgi:5'-deoxynucleotidase YfbR-like HD superfamily hydrolase